MGYRSFVALVLTTLLAACNGSNAVPPPVVPVPPTATPVATASPTPTPGPAGATAILTTSMSASTSLTVGPIGPGDSSLTSCAPASAVSHLTIGFSLTQPGGTPTVAAVHRVPRTIGGSNITPFGYIQVTPDVTVTCPNTPAFAMTFGPGVTIPTASTSYVAVYDPNNAAAGWNTISGPGALTGNTISWTTGAVPFPLVAAKTYAFVLFTTSSVLTPATPTPTPTATPAPTATPTPTASPVPLHLYVGDDNAGAAILQFNLPLTNTTTSNFTMTATNNVVSLALDANGNLAAGLLNGSLNFFSAPLSAASTPTATFSNGGASNNGQLAFLATGDLWAATVSNRVNWFKPPYSNATIKYASLSNAGMVSDIGVAIDPAQNLYIGNAGTGDAAACAGTSQPTGGCGSNIYVYAPPYTGTAIVTPNVINFPFTGNSTAYRKIAVNGTRLYAASVANGAGRVDAWNLPITAASVPAFSLTTGVNTPEAVALDPAGNLYIGNLSDATVTVYSAPITSTSAPSVILKVSTGAFAIFGIAVGK